MFVILNKNKYSRWCAFELGYLGFSKMLIEILANWKSKRIEVENENHTTYVNWFNLNYKF